MDKQFRRLLPESAVRKERRAVYYYAPVLVGLYMESQTQSASFRQLGDDPLLDSGDSPALERYRAAKAEIAEFDLAVRRKEVLMKDSLLEALNTGAAGLRALIERWERRQRAAEAEEVRDAVHQGISALSKVVGDDCNLSRR